MHPDPPQKRALGRAGGRHDQDIRRCGAGGGAGGRRRLVGDDQEQAATTLGASRWQTFWRITLPAIRWGLTYGIVLTIARTLGEFGAVIMVSSNLPGQSQTMTLLVSDRYFRNNEYGAYAISTVLMAVAVLVLVAQVILDARRSRAAK